MVNSFEGKYNICNRKLLHTFCNFVYIFTGKEALHLQVEKFPK